MMERGATPVAELEIEVPAALRAEFDTFGRTEDVRFSPNGTQVALAGFGRDLVAVLDVVVRSGRSIEVASLRTYGAPTLRYPHGVDFLDEDHVVIANRQGSLTVLRLGDGQEVPLHPEPALAQPGSVRVIPMSGDVVELLVCENAGQRVRRLVARRRPDHVAITYDFTIADRTLRIPDGVAVTEDGSRMAVSNHEHHAVMLYDVSTRSPAPAKLIGIARGLRYPHGLRFVGDDRLLVADAGAPVIHTFENRTGWAGVLHPTVSARVMDTRTFARGRMNHQEGGPKGVDVHPDTRTVVVSSESQPLAFFDLARLCTPPVPEVEVDNELALLEERDQTVAAAARWRDAHELAEAGRAGLVTERDRLREELDRLTIERTAADARAAEERAHLGQLAAHVNAIEATKTWRLARRPRQFYAWLRRRRW